MSEPILATEGEPWACLVLEVEAADDAPFAPPQIEQLADGLVESLNMVSPACEHHRFEPMGFSLVRFGVGGRLAIHTWPEHRFATIDIWMCASLLDERDPRLRAFLESHGYDVTSRWLDPCGREDPAVFERHGSSAPREAQSPLQE